MKVEYTMDQMRAMNFDRQKRDAVSQERIQSTFDDLQLKKALEVLDQEIAKATAEAKPADAAPGDEKKDEKKEGDAEKKKAARIPFFPTTLKYLL